MEVQELVKRLHGALYRLRIAEGAAYRLGEDGDPDRLAAVRSRRESALAELDEVMVTYLRRHPRYEVIERVTPRTSWSDHVVGDPDPDWSGCPDACQVPGAWGAGAFRERLLPALHRWRTSPDGRSGRLEHFVGSIDIDAVLAEARRAERADIHGPAPMTAHLGTRTYRIQVERSNVEDVPR